MVPIYGHWRIATAGAERFRADSAYLRTMKMKNTKYITTVILTAFCTVGALAQTTDQVLYDSSYYARLEQPATGASYDTKILNPGSGILALYEHNNIVWSLASFREFNIGRRPGLERALTLWGANSTVTDTYVEPLYIEHGTLNLNAHINWDSGITIAAPRNPTLITGHSHGIWLDDQHSGVAGDKGRAIWYDGTPFQWSVEADGSSWIYTSSPYVSGNWGRFGLWCESGEECYISSQKANIGVAPDIAIQGPVLNIETDSVEVDDLPTLTGTCPDGTKPVFAKGLAVGCQ
jgi:hypothetical protein